ncbi:MULTISPECIES: nucleotide exchange factor GrpE [Prochlorococcus]|uniref:nucleotide exchange factor GrpE n=1 Tax=Prochlorococcus TaxID=1218 RepID=UPI000533A6AA|nr:MULTISPECIES: nucleotide exchange factor GrpE [Prochlorococcus]KGG13376.1 Heat shock protein GrpE [Prochlorococcus sp. MIT 0601]
MTEEVSAASQEDQKDNSNCVDSDQMDQSGSDTDQLQDKTQDQAEEVQESSFLEDSKDSSPQRLDNEARLEQLEREHETLRSQYVRIAADFDNFRKRQSRDQDDLRLQLKCNTLSDILPVVDNFERARQQLNPEGEEAQALHKSYQGLYKQLVDVLKQLGVAPMRVVGQSFDPNLHEAVLREPSEEMAEDIVIEELQRGYHLNGRVLRHALVKVSTGPGPTKKDEQTNEKSMMAESANNEDPSNMSPD